jgi:hypothetical protein
MKNLMPDSTELQKYYETLTDQQLLKLRSEGGFTAKAELELSNELAARHLGSHDVKRFVAATERGQLREEVVERGGGYRSPGIQFFGKYFLNSNDREANIQVRTKWFTISGIPLIPLASYRFKANPSSGSSISPNMHGCVINRVPICWPQVFITYAKTGAVIIGVGLLVVGLSELWIAFKHSR